MYLLDTNACIAVINGKPLPVRMRLRKEFDREARVFVSSVVAFELWYGVAKSARAAANAQLLTTFFAGPVGLMAFDDEHTKVAGGVRANLEAVGKPIGAYDLLIAGQALRHKWTLVTANSREFGRVKGLKWEDWGRG
jgi:tRNA(fMet)-specific endonuclease VapC